MKIDGVQTRPCIGCGYCCTQCVCSVGRNRGDSYLDVPCRFLTFHGGRHWCGVVEQAHSEKYKELICRNLAIGEGCCSGLNSWRREPIVDRRRSDR